MANLRTQVSALVFSAAALIGLVAHEDYVSKAMVPTKNDRPTVGFGSTYYADGRPVKMGDTITPVRALHTTQAHISKDEIKFRASLPGVEMYQGEYDIAINWVYQYGIDAWNKSEMRRDYIAGDYAGACHAYLNYKYLTSKNPTPGWEPIIKNGKVTGYKYDCCTPGNKVCRGVCTRQQERNQQCLALQK